MIYIKRSENNPFQQTPLYTNQVNLIREWLNDPQIEPKGWLPPSILLKQSSIKQKFHDSFNRKCAYCETTLGEEQCELDFFRPKKVEPSEGENNSSEAHYFWLTWTWSNFYLACDDCNSNKEDKFPISSNRQRAKPGTYDLKTLSSEEPLLLDPCRDNPNKHLIFDEDGTVAARFDEDGTVAARFDALRGSETIKILDLNRPELIKARKQEADQLKADFQDLILKIYNSHQQRSNIQQLVDDLKSQCEKDKPFAGMKRQLMFEWLKLLKDYLEKYIRDYYKKSPQLPLENSIVEKEVLIRNLLLLTSLQIKELPLNDLIIDLQNWLNEPNNSCKIFTLDKPSCYEQVPEWLKNLFPNEQTIQSLNSMIKLFTELNEENPDLQDTKTALSKLKMKFLNSELNTKYENSDLSRLLNVLINSPSGILDISELNTKYENSDLSRLLNVLINPPSGIGDIKSWPQATMSLALDILNEFVGRNTFVKIFVRFIESFDNEN